MSNVAVNPTIGAVLKGNASSLEPWTGDMFENTTHFGTDEGPTDTENLRTAFNFIQTALGIAIIAFNCVLLWWFVKYRFVERKPNVFIFSVCVGDLLGGITVIHTAVMNQFFKGSPKAEVPCVMAGSLQAICYGISLYSMAGAACENYLMIAHPFTHARYAESRIHLVIVAVMWVWMLAVGATTTINHIWLPGNDCYLLQIAGKLQYSILPMPQIIMLLIVITVLFVAILCIARRQRLQIEGMERRQLRDNHTSTAGKSSVAVISNDITDEGTSNTGAHATSGTTANEMDAAVKKRKRTDLVIALIVVMYISWFPLLMLIVLRVSLPTKPTSLAYIAFSETSNVMLFANALFNPFIYQRFSPDVEQAYRLCFRGRASVVYA